VKGTIEKYGGLAYWMSEYCVLGDFGAGRDLGMDTALHVAAIMHADLSVADAEAWQWWLAVAGGDWKDGLIYVDLDEAGNAGGVYPSKTLWAMAHYARFLRPGSRRVELDGSDVEAGLLATAWINTDGNPVVVLVNTTTEEKAVTLSGITASGQLYVTDSDKTLEPQTMKDGAFAMSGRSMATYVGA